MNSHGDELLRTLAKFQVKIILKISNFDIKNYKSHKTTASSF